MGLFADLVVQAVLPSSLPVVCSCFLHLFRVSTFHSSCSGCVLQACAMVVFGFLLSSVLPAVSFLFCAYLCGRSIRVRISSPFLARLLLCILLPFVACFVLPFQFAFCFGTNHSLCLQVFWLPLPNPALLCRCSVPVCCGGGVAYCNCRCICGGLLLLVRPCAALILSGVQGCVDWFLSVGVFQCCCSGIRPSYICYCAC